jgi:hypothetical protein
MTVMTEIIEILVSGITALGEGIGGSLSSLATSIFLTTEGALSTFGSLVAVFAGISLAFGLVRWVLNFITSLGNKNN